MSPLRARLARAALFSLAALFALTFHAPPGAQAQRRGQQQDPLDRERRRRPGLLEVHTSHSVTAPRDVLGFEPGADRKVADWTQIRNYFARLDDESPRVAVQEIGRTTLGRPLVVAVISAPENIRELEKYKEIQRRLADPRLVRSDAERERLFREGRAVVAISCSIHSTEVVGSQMSMQLAYELASANDPQTREILRNTILLLLPSANPDGNDIVADWYRKTLGTPHEGTEPPELYHHYAGHDNNRDWFMLNLAETRAVTRLFWREWFPQIVYDVHQQGQTGSRFFIPPFHDPANPRIAPLLLREVGLVGHKVAADLQAAGFRGVVTNALYDMWWHGGFRTAPYYHNSVGILSEAASADLMTPVTVKPEELQRASSRGMPSALPRHPTINFPDPWPGGLWRPADIRDMELVAARAVLSLAAQERERYLRNFYELGRAALDWPPKETAEPLAYLIPAGQGRDENLAKMVGLLVEQGVEVHRMDRELHLSHEGRDASRAMETPAGSYLVFLSQPQRTNVQALFERQVYPDRRTASGEAERPYDVAGWTLPMQMGLEALPVTAVREPESERRLTLVRDAGEPRRDLGLPLAADGAPKSPIRSPLARPRRIALYKSWTASMDEGWTRYVFDTFNVPFTSVRDAEVRAGNLGEKYDVIVLPSMRMRELIEGRSRERAPEQYAGGLTEAGVENLRRFVEEGGTLVAIDAATELAIKRFKLRVRNVLEGLRSSEFYCPGSILRVEVDTSHPVARGMRRETDAYFIQSQAFEVEEKEGVRVVARYASKKEEVLRSGWLLGPQHLTGRAALVEARMGRGRVVLFGFRPQHRAQTWGTFPLLFNALGQ